MDKNYSFNSERLTFRGITSEDAPLIVAWRSKPENYENFFNAQPVTLEGHLKWFERYLQDATRYEFMIIAPDGEPIGTVGLSSIDDESCEIGYLIGSENCRGKGYAKEAVRSATQVAFDELGVKYVDAHILASNAASMKVAIGGGFCEHERTYRAYNPAANPLSDE